MHRRAIVAVMSFAVLAVLIGGPGSVASPPPNPVIERQAVSFNVTNPMETPAVVRQVHGFLARPAGCTAGVVLALHGLSYGQWAWDFPTTNGVSYSVADALAARGYAVIAIDELGYNTSAGVGSPDHPNGYTLTVEAYAEMTAQILRQIRSGEYGGPAFDHVAVMGHSAGTEIAELTTALHPDLVDALIATAYTHEPFVNNDWLTREWSQDNLRAAQSDYEYFETDPATRAADMYELSNADTDVVAADNARAALTPSGEVFSIGLQPSRFVLATIAKPVLLLLAEHDELFPASYGPNERLLFSGTTATLQVVPDAGHAFMLQRNAAISQAMIGDWLDDHQAAVPACA